MYILLKIKSLLDRSLFAFLTILVGFLLFCVCWQVFSRYLLRIPATFTEELVRFLLIWVGMLGAALGFGCHRHLSLTIIFDKFPQDIQFFAQIFRIGIILFLSILILIHGGMKLIYVTWNQFSSILNIPMGYVYIILPLSGCIIAFYQIYDLIHLINHKKGDC